MNQQNNNSGTEQTENKTTVQTTPEEWKITEPKKALMIEALTKTLGVVSLAAEQAGISRSAHYNWMHTDDQYKAAVDSINETTLDIAESKLFECIRQSDFKAITFLLRYRGKSRGYSLHKETGIEKFIVNYLFKNGESFEAVMKTKSNP